MEGEYLSEIVDTSTISPGKLNLVDVPCGAGKTDYIKSRHMELSPTGILWTLYLIDTVAGKEALLKTGEEKTNLLSGEHYWEIDGIYVMTYAGFATMIMHEIENNKNEPWKNDSLIICDELHDCIKFSRWTKDNSIHRLALQYIKQRIKDKSNLVVALSATSRRINECFSGMINKVKLNGVPRHYTNDLTTEYRSLPLLLKQIEKGQRGIIFIPQITQIKKYLPILREKGIKCEGIWSINNTDHEMSAVQNNVRDYLIEKQCIHPDYDILIINAAYETSINIRSTIPIDFMIIHTTDEDTQIQVRGRYRDDLKQLYLPSHLGKLHIIIPLSYVDKPLYKKDKDELCELFQAKNNHNRDIKWPTIKKELIKNGYFVQEYRTNAGRYTTIKFNEVT